jgi:hypothetical protein
LPRVDLTVVRYTLLLSYVVGLELGGHILLFLLRIVLHAIHDRASNLLETAELYEINAQRKVRLPRLLPWTLRAHLLRLAMSYDAQRLVQIHDKGVVLLTCPDGPEEGKMSSGRDWNRNTKKVGLGNDDPLERWMRRRRRVSANPHVNEGEKLEERQTDEILDENINCRKARLIALDHPS